MTNAISTAPVADLQRAVAGGFVATLVFTLLMYYGAPVLTGFPMDVSQTLTSFFGDNALLGTMLHYVTGAIAYPVALLILQPLLPKSLAVKGLLWGIAMWLGANLVLLPFVGAGVFMTNYFQGRALVAPEIASLIGHVVYALVLVAMLEMGAPRRAARDSSG